MIQNSGQKKCGYNQLRAHCAFYSITCGYAIELAVRFSYS